MRIVFALTQSTWQAIADTVSSMAGQVRDTVARMVDDVLGWFGSLKDKAIEKVKGMVDGVTSWLKDMYSKVVGGSIIPDMVLESEEWIERLKTQGVAITKDMAQGMTGMVDSLGATVRSSFAHTFEQVISGAMSFSEGIKSIFTNLVDAVKKKLIDVFADKLVQSAISLFTGGFGDGGGV